jgi:rhamnopyranosyl-N-acetylglucosaminyl-diphospho-decaprenol beta-1,3/1,4-galactofuranosyltransferase
MEPNVGVVIVTYNRLDLLKITICKVLSQTLRPSEILIVDNYSTDGTREYLKTLKDVSTLLLSENEGPAGGFYEGIKYFAERSEVDYVWLMDDDFFPFKSCLEILANSVDSETMVFPYIREKDFISRRDPGWWGVLIPKSIISKVGYPKKELFFWTEDSEYLLHRIRGKFKFKARWISSAKGVHFTKRVKNHRPPWKFYYETRNMLYMRLYERDITVRRSFKLIKSWIKLLGSIVFKENKKGEKLSMFLLGTMDGVNKRLGKRVDPISGKKL